MYVVHLRLVRRTVSTYTLCTIVKLYIVSRILYAVHCKLHCVQLIQCIVYAVHRITYSGRDVSYVVQFIYRKVSKRKVYRKWNSLVFRIKYNEQRIRRTSNSVRRTSYDGLRTTHIVKYATNVIGMQCKCMATPYGLHCIQYRIRHTYTAYSKNEFTIRRRMYAAQCTPYIVAS